MAASPEDIRRAHLILDKARSGVYVSSRVITLALTITGDLPAAWKRKGPILNHRRKS